MDRGMVLFLGALLTFSSSWAGLVFAPLVKLSQLKPEVVDDTTNEMYPKPMSGIVAEGFDVYKSSGCFYCHSQQIRHESFGRNTDIIRGWGTRRSVPRDYLYDRPVQLGTMRTGPDLSTVGVRLPSEDWHHKHLYDPKYMTPGSIMPPFAWLYEKRKIVGQESVDSLNFGEEAGKFHARDEEIVPTTKAKALVEYLRWLKKATVELPETKE